MDVYIDKTFYFNSESLTINIISLQKIMTITARQARVSFRNIFKGVSTYGGFIGHLSPLCV